MNNLLVPTTGISNGGAFSGASTPSRPIVS